MYRPLETVISIFLSAHWAMMQTAQKAFTKGGLWEWFCDREWLYSPDFQSNTLWQSNSLSLYVQCKDNVPGHSFRFQKTPVPLTPMASKSPFLAQANPIASPDQKEREIPSDAVLWVSANQIRNIFQRRPFSPRMSPSVALSLFILFSWA